MPTPNTTFTIGAVLTAAQQNNFPRGIMTYVQSTTSSSSYTSETLQLTTPSFTAVANRYYKITYFEPYVYKSGSSGTSLQRLRLTNIAGTNYQSTYVVQSVGAGNFMIAEYVTTFSAGSTVIVGTTQSGSGTNQNFRAATYPAFLVVEDIGPT
jgi:hypothetical protein